MTKVFFDTEFMEDGTTIEALSFGFVAETGQKLYLVVLDADLNKANDWVRENVLPHLYVGCSNPMWKAPTEEAYITDGEGTTYAQVEGWKVGATIQHWVEEVCPINPKGHPRIPDPPPSPEFWADYGSYDWVLLCQQYGTMLDRPSGWPMFVRDIQQLKWDVGFDGKLPEVEGQAHNALDDALNVKERYEFLSAMRPEGKLLNLAYSALSAIKRLGFPLDDTWPEIADEAYDKLGDHLWPDDYAGRS